MTAFGEQSRVAIEGRDAKLLNTAAEALRKKIAELGVDLNKTDAETKIKEDENEMKNAKADDAIRNFDSEKTTAIAALAGLCFALVFWAVPLINICSVLDQNARIIHHNLQDKIDYSWGY